MRLCFNVSIAGILASGLSCLGQTVNIPATWSYPTSSANSAQPGFNGKIRQARQTASLSATISRVNDHLNDLSIDPETSLPYANTAVDVTNPDVIAASWPGSLAVQTDGTFFVPSVLNYSASANGEVLAAQDGTFVSPDFPDNTFPGFPGETFKGGASYQNGLNMSVEFLTYIHLPAGQTVLTMRNDEASQLAIHPNDARDIFRTGLIESNTNNPFANRNVTVDVVQSGLYSIRLLLAQWMGSTGLEFSSGGPALSRTLVNAPGDPGGPPTPPIIQISNSAGNITLNWSPPEGILLESADLITRFEPATDQSNPQSRSATGKGFFRVAAPGGNQPGLPAWRSLTASTRPYVTAVSPQPSQSGVQLNANIVVTMQNRNGTTPVMRVGGTQVAYTVVNNGTESTLTYDPPNFTGGQLVNVELDYGNATAMWNFAAATGNKAILIANSLSSDTGLKARLANDFGLDVKVHLDTENSGAALAALVADASDAKLIWHSATSAGANGVNIAVALRDLPVPIICVESTNSDEYRIASTNNGSNVPSGNPNVNIVILNSGHPTAAGLAPGTYSLVNPKEQAHFCSPLPAPEVVRVAEAPPYGTPASNVCTLCALESGVTVDPTGPSQFFHKNRRVFFGAVGNEGAGKLASPTGVSIFNAVVNWALAGVPTTPPP